MTTQVKLSEDGRYILVTQDGPVSISHIKTARADSLPLYNSCDRALVDFRRADISNLTLVELDNLGTGFRQDVPKCMRMAIVTAAEFDRRRYSHLANVHTLYGVRTEIFEDMEAAKAWLLDESMQAL